MKKCCTCKIKKPLEEFHFKHKTLGIRVNSCKNCNSLATKRYREKNKDKINTRCRLFRQHNPVKRILWASKQRAKRLYLPFQLTELDLHCPTHCPYLGLELHYAAGKQRSDNTASLDRIIPTLGYIPGNVEIVSDLANRMKNSANKEQLIMFAKAVLEKYGIDL